jgi:predicted branched-subunit amino acid permease
LPAYKSYPALALMTDPAWIIGIRYHREGGQDWGVYLGACVFLYLLWVVSVVPGYYLAAALEDPARYGVDLIMPIFFITMLVPLWRGRMDGALGGGGARRAGRQGTDARLLVRACRRPGRGVHGSGAFSAGRL